jgi:predicted amidohydrolase YtcJ
MDNPYMMKTVSHLIADNVFGYPAGQAIGIKIHQGRFTQILPLPVGEVEAYLSQGAPAGMLDLRGMQVLPGMTDAHVHAIASGMLMLGGFLSAVTTLDEIEAAYKLESAQSGEYVRLAGLDLSRLQPQGLARLNRAWLDGLAPTKPFIIKSVEGHSSWFNTVAWERLGISSILESCTANPADVQQMWVSGRVFGEAYENLANAIYDTYSANERREGMQRLLKHAAEVGLVGIHCMEGYGEHRREDFELIRELDGQTCRLTLYARDSSPLLAEQLGLKRFGGCWCVDGAIGSYTAALSEPYIDKPESTGVLYYTDDELSAWIESGLREGMQVCVHAIGDRALEQTITIYERLSGRYDLAALRPRVEHFILGTTALAQRAARLGICSAMQPAFDARWGGRDGGYASRLGPERALQTNPVGQMIAAGLKVAGSSDSYITPLDPLGGIQAAINHHNPDQRVAWDVAVRMFSEQAAYLAHNEECCGRIAAGLAADLTVVSIGGASQQGKVLFTVIEGRIVYESAALPE